jgi:hypothetical protein
LIHEAGMEWNKTKRIFLFYLKKIGLRKIKIEEFNLKEIFQIKKGNIWIGSYQWFGGLSFPHTIRCN